MSRALWSRGLALVLMLVACVGHTPGANVSDAGRLPLAYIAATATYPWTGTLRAVGWRTVSTGQTQQPATDVWEAGALLDRRDPDSRLLYTSIAADGDQPERIVALQWAALDVATQAMFDSDPADGSADGLGQRRLAWLRGGLGIDGLRVRDTRLGNARGARGLVVGPPAWQPGQPGHALFRARHSLRPPTVWLGTADGLLHGFDAISGAERAAYLPRGALRAALGLTAPSGKPPAPPCPRPQAVDAQIGPDWRTLLLCGLPARPGSEDVAGVFVLDVSDPQPPSPLRLVWEVAATEALPLSARGPVRAAALDDGGRLLWYAIATLAAGTAGDASPPGLALLPLGKPAQAPWLGAYRVLMLWLPSAGCDGKAVTGALSAVSVQSDMSGKALAAYATDDTGQLWRFDLARLLSRPEPARCIHQLPRQPIAADNSTATEAPLVLGAPGEPLIVYGAGNEIAAVADGPGRDGAPSRVTAQSGADGVILRSNAGAGPRPAAGWRLTLPHPGEQLDEIAIAAPGYLSFSTRAPDGSQRAYLVHAASGESTGRTQPGAPPAYFATGRIAGTGEAAVVPTVTALASDPPQAGASSREAHEAALWAVDGATARPLAATVTTRRTGRLSWRELAVPPTQDSR